MPAADVAVRIARVLGVSVEYLITGQETAADKVPLNISPQIRRMARIAEKLKPDYQRIALSFIETLKKHEELQGNS
jgi:transcriptional regulator with XRE-family HTH domain